jgi:response regulator RpfG family c-di-GMP phosphodiesterase
MFSHRRAGSVRREGRGPRNAWNLVVAKHRILLVDDDQQAVELIQDVLGRDYDLASVQDAQRSVRFVHEFSPDLMFLDAAANGADGYDICRQIKSGPMGDFVQVMLVSKDGSTTARMKAYEVQADDYLVKPFDRDELMAKVRVQFRLREALTRIWEANAQVHRQNEQLEQLVAERTAQIIATQDVTVFALAQLAESRDLETGLHLERIRSYSGLLADELQKSSPYSKDITAEFLEDLYRSSPLHDIGKVGVPDNILLKPGSFTPEEYLTMKQHVLVGAETLEKAAQRGGCGRFLTMAAQIARYHHERYDGTGYCEGLKGQRIPLAARIVSLADMYDALTTVRVYKPAYDPVVARDMIKAECGRQFDPAVVGAFLRRFGEFQALAPTSTPQLVA